MSQAGLANDERRESCHIALNFTFQIGSSTTWERMKLVFRNPLMKFPLLPWSWPHNFGFVCLCVHLLLQRFLFIASTNTILINSDNSWNFRDQNPATKKQLKPPHEKRHEVKNNFQLICSHRHGKFFPQPTKTPSMKKLFTVHVCGCVIKCELPFVSRVRTLTFFSSFSHSFTHSLSPSLTLSLPHSFYSWWDIK